MIEETGRVVRAQDDFAWVETHRRSACHSCSAQNGCGTGLFGRMFSSRRSVVRVLNTADVRPGDEVVLGLAEQALVRGSLAVYAAPLVAMMAGAMLADWLWPFGASGDPAAVAGGFGGFALGLLWVRRFAQRIRADERYQPVILRSVHSEAGAANGVWSP